jgi:hypothetical protein
MFLVDRGDARIRALEEWRQAARIVAARWAVFLDADALTRRFAFRSYVAALDAEEAAAAAFARLCTVGFRPSSAGVSPAAA